LKAYLSPQRFDFLAHGRDNAGQTKSPYVGFVYVENFFRCTGTHKFLHNLAAVKIRIFDLAVEFAIRKKTSTTLAKLNVGCRVEHAIAPQPPGILGALAHLLAAFQHQWSKAH